MKRLRTMKGVSEPEPQIARRLPRVLVMTHSHPRLTRGGAEISANTLFRELKARGAATWLLGCANHKSEVRLGASLTQPHGPDDYLYQPNAPFDYFKFANPDPQFPKLLEELVAELRPDIVHTHHFVRFGVEMFAAIRRGWPQAKIVLSLHEYLAICNHHGQMMKTGSFRLCERESYEACAACFPDYAQRDFFLRKRYLQLFLSDVDLFVAPSRFLAERFRAWGLPDAKLAVLENMPPERTGSSFADRWDHDHNGEPVAIRSSPISAAPSPRPMPMFAAATSSRGKATDDSRRQPIKIGFFGQMSPLKGIDVLMEAARRLTEMGIDTLEIDIHGDYSSQPIEFQAGVTSALAQSSDNVVYHGPYDNTQVNALMQRVDAVVIPSTWWENSPVVIQEAFTNGKPVICSNIGGMAEKVVHGVNGLQFEVGRPMSLAETLSDLATKSGLLAQITAGVRPPPTASWMLDQHLDLYASVMP